MKKHNPNTGKNVTLDHSTMLFWHQREGRWWLRNEGGREGGKHCLFLDIFLSKDNSSLG